MFHIVSVIIPLALLIPNFLFFRSEPTEVLEKNGNHNKQEIVFTIFERVGQIGIFCIPIFYKIHLDSIGNKISLSLMCDISLNKLSGFVNSRKHIFILQ